MEVGLRAVSPDLPLLGLRARRQKSGDTVVPGRLHVAWNAIQGQRTAGRGSTMVTIPGERAGPSGATPNTG